MIYRSEDVAIFTKMFSEMFSEDNIILRFSWVWFMISMPKSEN